MVNVPEIGAWMIRLAYEQFFGKALDVQISAEEESYLIIRSNLIKINAAINKYVSFACHSKEIQNLSDISVTKLIYPHLFIYMNNNFDTVFI